MREDELGFKAPSLVHSPLHEVSFSLPSSSRQVFLLLGVGPEMRKAVGEGLRQMYPWSLYQGETYYWFLRNMMIHDEKCHKLELVKTITRNRVLTSWVTLHQMAVSLAKHRPEFTLQVVCKPLR